LTFDIAFLHTNNQALKNTSLIDHPALPRLGQWSWLLLCWVLPISGGLVPVPLALTIGFALLCGLRHAPRINWRALWPLFGFYALHIIGMYWTSDMDFGLFDIQVKLGLVLLPLAGAVFTASWPGLLRRSMLAFTAGILVSVVLGTVKALGCYSESGLLNCFSQSTMSFQLHPSYAAWYVCWCIAYWGHQLITGAVGEKRLRIAVVVILPVVLLFAMMLASKSGVIGIAVVVLFLLGLALLRLRGRLRTVVIGSALLAVVGTGVFQGPLVKARMEAALEAFTAGLNGDGGIYTSSEGSAMRMVAWTCSLQRLRTDPWGAGTGDIKHALMECYEAKGAVEAAQRRLNSHSQFLQGGVALGWPGLVLAALLAFIPLVHGLRQRNVPLVLFMLLYILNGAVESVLEVQAGVVFFALFLGLLAAQARTSSLNAPNTAT
jgi:hypothetical protein